MKLTQTERPKGSSLMTGLDVVSEVLAQFGRRQVASGPQAAVLGMGVLETLRRAGPLARHELLLSLMAIGRTGSVASACRKSPLGGSVATVECDSFCDSEM